MQYSLNLESNGYAAKDNFFLRDLPFTRDKIEKGCSCPTCHQHVQLYRRKLNSGMARTLIHIYKEDSWSGKWIQVKKFLKENGFDNNHDWTLLRHWGLLEEKPKEKDADERSSGYWKISTKGRLFCEDKIKVDEAIYQYNGMVYYMGQEKQIGIQDALTNKFSYQELMNKS